MRRSERTEYAAMRMYTDAGHGALLTTGLILALMLIADCETIGGWCG